MVEVWRDVVGYERIYEVSSHGRVRTHKNKTTHSDRNGVRKWKQRILKEKNPQGREVRVTLWKDKKDTSYLVHRLVAEAFIEKEPGKDIINHKDGNPRNNYIGNLEWCDHKHNNNHAFDNGLMQTNTVVFLVDKETNEPKMFRSMSKAGQFLGRNHGYISHILKKGQTEVDNYRIFLAIRPDEYEVS